jgi:uncharacterized membrane protein YtjA (UPF0391 family)
VFLLSRYDQRISLEIMDAEVRAMFRWAIIFAVIALLASFLGFGGVAGLSKDFAVIFLVVAVVLLIIGFLAKGK